MSNESDYKKFLHEIVEKYEAQGYRVAVGPSPRSVPRFMRSFVPDIVAEKGGQRVAIKVQDLSTNAQSAALRQLSAALADHPEWRLDVALYEPLDTDEPRLPSPRTIERYLKQARTLHEGGDHAAAFLLAWSAFEASARRAIRKLAGEDEGRKASMNLVKLLLSLGLVDKEVHQRLVPIARRRNEIAHGELSLSAPFSMIVTLDHATRDLLAMRVRESA